MTGDTSGEFSDLLEPKEIERPSHTIAAVLDGGSQFTAHIVRTVRAEGSDAVVLPKETPLEEIQGRYDVVFASGGPGNADDEEDRIDPRLMNGESDIPFMGICLGMHEMILANGGRVQAYTEREVTVEEIEVLEPGEGIFSDLESVQTVQNNHGVSAKVSDLPDGFRAIAMSGNGESEFVAGMSDGSGTRVATQYHPEVDPTTNGSAMISNFMRENCGLACDFVPEEHRVVAARKIAPVSLSGEAVLIGLSGGVDSAVTGALIHESIGDRLVGLHIDTGSNRKGEADHARKVAEYIGMNLTVVDASEEFRNATRYIDDKGVAHESPTRLADTYDHTIERLIFSTAYARVIKNALAELGLSHENSYLAQGTLWTDEIESGQKGRSTATIKPHHNIGGAFDEWEKHGKLVAPMNRFFKGDVREIGEEIGLPDEYIWRQPFPGPGLILRILNLQAPPEFANYDQVDRQLDQFRSNDDSVHILPLRFTGNAGDGPEYKNLVAITSDDGLQDRHFEMGRAIPNAVRDIGGAIYIEGGKTPQNVDVYDRVVPTNLGPQVMSLAQEVDAEVDEVSVRHGLNRSLAQEPVMLAGFNPYGTEGRLAALRPVSSLDFFTAQAVRPGSKEYTYQAYKEQVEAANGVDGIGATAIVLTDKPPLTIEAK